MKTAEGRRRAPRAPSSGPAAPRENRGLLRRGAAAPLLLILLTFLAWSNSFKVPFLFDDLGAIPNNPTLRDFRQVLNPPVETTVYARPLLNLTFALNYAAGGLSVAGYHLVNLLIHAGAGLLLFAIVRRTLRSGRLAARFGDSATPLAFFTAALWLLHPVQTQSVTYIVQRAESLVGLLLFLTLYLAIRGAGSARPAPWYAAAVAVCALGMGAKEVMVTAPVLVLFYDRAFMAGTFREAFTRRKALYAGLALTWVVLLPLVVRGRPGSAGFGVEGMTWYEYARTQGGVVLHYLRLSLLPWPLVFDYDWPVASARSAVVPALTVLTLAAGGLLLFRGNRPSGFLAAWFFAILAPSSSVVPVATEVAAEHRLYLPLASVAAFVVVGGYGVISGRAGQAGAGFPLRRPAFFFALALLCAALIVSTLLRNRAYNSPTAIWSDTVAKRPDNVRARYNLAKALQEAGQVEAAVREYRKVVNVRPGYPGARLNLGMALSATRQFEAAVKELEAAVAAAPDSAEAHNNLGLVLARSGQTARALNSYEEALRLNPGYAAAWYNKGNAHAGAGQAEDAIRSYREALRIEPDLPAAHMNLAVSLERAGHLEEAVEHYHEAIAARPGHAKGHLALGMLLARMGQTSGAIQALNAALSLEPNLSAARETLHHLQRR